MADHRRSEERTTLLADVAEMYYLEDMDQAQIAREVGVTRSMVSRMLKQARQLELVEIRVHRPLRSAYDLELALVERFGLEGAYVVAPARLSRDRVLSDLGRAAAQMLKRYLQPGMILGLSWGTSVSATVDAIESEQDVPMKIVQLVGALGARSSEYDGNALVLRLADKLGGEGYILNAPFLCPSPETVSALLQTQSVREAIKVGRQSSVVVMGIGTTHPRFSSYYLAGFVPIDEIERLREAGSVGDVCGLHFDALGQDVGGDFCERLVTIQKSDLLRIPTRIGVAGGQDKVEPILGALRGGYVTILVTDAGAAKKVLDIADEAEG